MSEFSDKVKTIGFVGGRHSQTSVDVVDADGQVIGLSRLDDFGNIVTEYNDRQDVTIRTATVVAGGTVLEAS